MKPTFSTGHGPVDLDELLGEIERYLEAVQLFRAEGCEPRWTTRGAEIDWRPLGCRLAALYEAA